MGNSSKRAEHEEETKSVRQGYLDEAQVNQTETTQPDIWKDLPIFGRQKKETTTTKKKVLSTSEVEKKLKSQCETQQ
jgi:phage pi2 protein 07